MEYFTFAAEKEDVGTRLDVFLAENMEDLSRSAVQKLVEGGHIQLNGGSVKSNYKLREKDVIDVEVPEAKEIEILPEDIPLDILYEDADVIVVNKPQGMVVHPAPGHYTGTLVNALMYHCGSELSGINGEKRPRHCAPYRQRYLRGIDGGKKQRCSSGFGGTAGRAQHHKKI